MKPPQSDNESRPENWQRRVSDAFGAAGGVWLWLVALLILLAALLLPALAKLKRALGSPEVIAYVAQDQVYAEPLLAEFTRQTGIRVRTVFDSEAVKTVGLANRLLAERHRPQCDVFWGNEELRTRQLAAQDVWRETNAWAAFGYRSRRIISTPTSSPPTSAPRTPNLRLRTSDFGLRTSDFPRSPLVARAHERPLARQGRPRLPGLRYYGDASPRPAPTLGRGEVGGLVPRPGRERADGRGRQLGRREAGGEW